MEGGHTRTEKTAASIPSTLTSHHRHTTKQDICLIKQTRPYSIITRLGVLMYGQALELGEN